MNQPKYIPFLGFLILIIPFIGSANQQDIDFKGLYVWDFVTEEGQKNQLTQKFTTLCEKLISQHRPDLNLVNRRNLNQLAKHEKNELIINETSDEIIISNQLKNWISTQGANIVLLGKIGRDLYVGNYSITVQYADIFTKKIVFVERIEIEEEKIYDTNYLQNSLLKTIPNAIKITDSEDEIPEGFTYLTQENPWLSFKPLYYEDFSDINKEGFLGYIWNKKSHDDYNHSVKSGKYFFDIKKSKLIRHKFIGSKNFTYHNNFNPYSITVSIPKNTDLYKTNMGRGLTMKYNNKKKSCYAFLLDDTGNLKFLRVYNISQSNNIEELYSKKINVSPGKSYELGVICIKNRFFLYFNGAFIHHIQDYEFNGEKNGVIAFGKGEHFIDSVSIFKAP